MPTASSRSHPRSGLDRGTGPVVRLSESSFHACLCCDPRVEETILDWDGSGKRVPFSPAKGLVEVINVPFTPEKLNRIFAGLWDGETSPVAVLNPIAKENAEMRLSLIPGLIENLRANLAQKAESFCAYHLGKVFCLGRDGDD